MLHRLEGTAPIERWIMPRADAFILWRFVSSTVNFGDHVELVALTHVEAEAWPQRQLWQRRVFEVTTNGRDKRHKQVWCVRPSSSGAIREALNNLNTRKLLERNMLINGKFRG